MSSVESRVLLHKWHVILHESHQILTSQEFPSIYFRQSCLKEQTYSLKLGRLLVVIKFLSVGVS